MKTLSEWGDVDKAIAQADVVKEFTYSYRGSVPVPLQPISCVAKWDGDKVTVWGTGQNIYPSRANIAKRLGISVENVRFVDKWNGGTFGGADAAGDKFYGWIAHIAKVTGRPTKMVLPKDQELAQLKVKPETMSKFKVGATKDGQILACEREFHVNTGVNPGSGVDGGGGGRSELFMHVFPNWREIGFLYRTNQMVTGAARSNYQQEFKWAWEQMVDEMAEAVGIDPVQFRLLNVQKPGTKVALKQGSCQDKIACLKYLPDARSGHEAVHRVRPGMGVAHDAVQHSPVRGATRCFAARCFAGSTMRSDGGPAVSGLG